MESNNMIDTINNFFNSVYKYFSMTQSNHTNTINKLIENYGEKNNNNINLIENFDKNIYHHTKYHSIQKLWNIYKERVKRSENLQSITNYNEKTQLLIIMYEVVIKNTYLLIHTIKPYLISIEQSEINNIWKSTTSILMLNLSLYKQQIEFGSNVYQYIQIHEILISYINYFNEIFVNDSVEFNKIDLINKTTFRYLTNHVEPLKLNIYYNEKMNINFNLTELNNEIANFQNSLNELDKDYLSFYFKFYKNFVNHYLHLDFNTNKMLIDKLIEFKDNFYKSINLFKEEEDFIVLSSKFIKV